MIDIALTGKNNFMNQRGFTLIEIVMVIVLLGILAITAIPKYIDLTASAKASSTQASLGAIRSYVYMEYANRATDPSIGASFPPSINSSDFSNNNLPLNQINGLQGIEIVSSVPLGTATSPSYGFWYIPGSGAIGAYSDGTTDTANW